MEKCSAIRIGHLLSPTGKSRVYLKLLVDGVPVLTAWHSSITGESVDHTRVGSDGGKSAEPASKNQDHHENNTSSITHTVHNDLHDWEIGGGADSAIQILNTE